MNLKKLSSFFFEIGTLRFIGRSHRQALLTNDISDNIASHSYRVSVIAYFLAKLAKADVKKTVTMALFHDIGETRSGDQNWINKKYLKVFDQDILNDQATLFQDESIKKLIKTYEKRSSLEAKLAKDADLLDQIILLMEYSHSGNKEAKRWLGPRSNGLKNGQYLRLSNPISKKIARQIMAQKPSTWWNNSWQGDRR